MSTPMEKLNVLYILVGPGGVGKNALMKEVLKQVDGLRQLPTATTRRMRKGEVEGRDHRFVSLETFEQMIADQELLEYQEVHPGKYYGVPRDTVEQAIVRNEALIADIEVLGASIIQRTYPEHSLSIFIVPPSVQELRARLENRNATDGEIVDRIKRLPMEMLHAPLCDYIIVNDDMRTAVSQLIRIIRAERGEEEPPDDLDQVNFSLQLWVQSPDGVLVRSTDATYPKRQLNIGESPELIAQEMVQQFVDNPDNVQTVQYRRPNGEMPVDLDYDADNATYTLTYHFTCELMKPQMAPAGWQWRTTE